MVEQLEKNWPEPTVTDFKILWDCAFYPVLVSGITESWMVTDVIALPLARAWGAEGPAEYGPEGKPRGWARGGRARHTLTASLKIDPHLL